MHHLNSLGYHDGVAFQVTISRHIALGKSYLRSALSKRVRKERVPSFRGTAQEARNFCALAFRTAHGNLWSLYLLKLLFDFWFVYMLLLFEWLGKALGPQFGPGGV